MKTYMSVVPSMPSNIPHKQLQESVAHGPSYPKVKDIIYQSSIPSVRYNLHQLHCKIRSLDLLIVNTCTRERHVINIFYNQKD